MQLFRGMKTPPPIRNAEEIKEGVEGELSKAQQKVKRKLVLRNKISAVGKMSKMMQVMRENHEVLLEMKSMSPDGRLPRGALLDLKGT